MADHVIPSRVSTEMRPVCSSDGLGGVLAFSSGDQNGIGLGHSAAQLDRTFLSMDVSTTVGFLVSGCSLS